LKTTHNLHLKQFETNRFCLTGVAVTMEEHLTITELEKRWEDALAATRNAVSRHPDVYRKLKSLAGDIVEKQLDIKAYMPTAEKLTGLLNMLDPESRGSIFSIFKNRIAPCSIWQVPLLRMECKDLLAHLRAFDAWRHETSRLKLIK
jgi:hypothetical protein